MVSEDFVDKRTKRLRKMSSKFSRSAGEVDIHAHFGHLISAVLLVKEITVYCNWALFFMPRENELTERILRT